MKKKEEKKRDQGTKGNRRKKKKKKIEEKKKKTAKKKKRGRTRRRKKKIKNLNERGEKKNPLYMYFPPSPYTVPISLAPSASLAVDGLIALLSVPFRLE